MLKEPDINQVLSAFGQVAALELDDDLRDHLWERGFYGKHRVSVSEILEVYQLNHKLFVNSSPSGRAPLMMVGITAQGRFLCVPIEPTDKWGVWRAITAFEANAHHIARYQGD